MLVWWIGAVAIAAVAAVVFVFNDLVAARNQVRAAWSDIDVQLTRRHDLVPQLVAAVQGYASYERATLSTVTELRTRVGLSTVSLHDRIPPDERVFNVVVTASYAVVGRFRERYEAADEGRAGMLLTHFGVAPRPPDELVFGGLGGDDGALRAMSARIRDDIDTPVLVLNSEGETMSLYPVRQPDTATFR